MEGRTSQKEDLKPTGSLVTTRVPGLVVAECNRIDRSIEETVLRKLDFKYIHGVYCKSGGAVADADARLLPVLSLASKAILESASTTDNLSRNARNKAPLRPRLLVILAHSKTALDKVLQELSTPPRWSIEEELRNLQGNNHINRPEYAQTLCAAVQIALVNLLKGWGVSMSGTIRHSSGEVIAAYGAGAIPIYTAIITAHLCGQ
ncbi:uncharacterized protein BDW43DRAFT_308374 [Aspergillus alliaceus]|uniref:uncharacterized protein n=1 Tax=Petromyces alliaceus TaxID=209559 RepID=UPI0012A523DC|nr:uncharacterized protein BDW43DRAFT_308374 [Aspergillus alliaceus]KAB8236698.1 hypothetical protein BDW43DRAFT_308374 [Aspergillus alliaceus]